MTAALLSPDRQLDPWLAILTEIAAGGKRCERCKGAKGKTLDIGPYTQTRWEPCLTCDGTGKLPPPDLISQCQVFADWLEDRADVRAGLVRPVGWGEIGHYPPGLLRLGTDLAFRWLPDGPAGLGVVDHAAEAARRLLLLFRKPCEQCDGRKQFDCNEPGHGSDCVIGCRACSGLGYFPQQIVVGDAAVPVPVEVATCPCGAKILANFSPRGDWVVRCEGNGGNALAEDIARTQKIAEQWAANHLLRIPEGVTK